MGHSEKLRATAVTYYERCQGDKVKAAKRMRDELGASCPDHTARFIESCAARYEEQHNFNDRGRSGRPQKVPPETATRLARILKEGRRDGQPFCDIMEAAVSDPIVEGQVVQAQATTRTIKRAVRKANPNLVQTSVAMKP
mgnify:FL=1